MFERNFDGKCRRFRSGIVPLRDGSVAIEFSRWAKLEGVYTGRLQSFGIRKFWANLDRFVAMGARIINRLMAFVPGRIGAITIYRRLKLWFDRYAPLNRTRIMRELVARIWADREVRLHFVIISNGHETFDELLVLQKGWNEHTLKLPEVRRNDRLLFFSTSEDEFKLVFNMLELVPAITEEQVVQEKKDVDVVGPAQFVKCIAWDLDNTLWKGILVEDGENNLALNEEAVDVIKELDKRGIVSTVISKNDYDRVWPVLERFGISDYFIFPFINWLPKSGNLRAAAKTININLNTFAFVDDSAFERGEVSEQCPQVRVFKNTEIGDILGRPEFNPPISPESAGRRMSYQREMKRIAAASEFNGDYDAFLKSCRITLNFFDLKQANDAEYERAYELIQRSNQLTLTGNRYEKENFRRLVLNKDRLAWGIRCCDRFGDYGIIGCVVIENEGSERWRVKEFVMSCRVAKKGCETMAIDWVREEITKRGGKYLVADIVDTGRNLALQEAFKAIRFD